MKLLYFAPLSHGGLADYAREQAGALARAGVEVELLCSTRFPEAKEPRIHRVDALREASTTGGGRLTRAVRFASTMIGQHRALARRVRAGGHRRVLLGSYAEYFAPVWAPTLRKLARSSVVFGAVVHDPVRDAVLGGAAWHRRSIAAGYSFLAHAFVHEQIELDTAGGAAPEMRVTTIPHGPYAFRTVTPSREEARRRLQLPAHAPVVLAFGHIRDNKNLDLVVRALAHVPEVHLLVAGSELSSGQKPASHYRELAASCGVADRCHWHVRFVTEEETGVFFAAADHLALTYGSSFRSASGVLSASAQFRIPCLASSGPSPLRSLVRKYRLGVWVEPDDADAVTRGLRALVSEPPRPLWDDFVRENSWEENARIVVQTLFNPDVR
ncbi:hypothetical protein ASA1KI_32040 [Opitutales bacterium ASA1]|uniref:glycosyltransferase family 4 protein n=1 Tax=Congregicoccus parvus TaxID=3081749 RepID=UPI002B2D5A89|nr:hypothetical protein ASA1KI_32040 [Opitutales bacterium ASA1]